jgi:hypothetical protein
MTMQIIRYILPFLFVRNWYDGSWELSRARLILFFAFMVLVVVGFGIAYVLQSPVVYESKA